MAISIVNFYGWDGHLGPSQRSINGSASDASCGLNFQPDCWWPLVNPVASGNMLVFLMTNFINAAQWGGPPIPASAYCSTSPPATTPGFPSTDTVTDVLVEVNQPPGLIPPPPYSPPAGTFAGNSVDICYCLSVDPSTTRFFSGGCGNAPGGVMMCWLLEVHSDAGAFTFDTAGVLAPANGTSVTSCPGPVLATVNGNQQPVWTQSPAGNYIIEGAAFKDPAGSSFCVAIINSYGVETGIASPWIDGEDLFGYNIATLITTPSGTFCGGMSSQAVGNPLIKGTAKSVRI